MVLTVLRIPRTLLAVFVRNAQPTRSAKASLEHLLTVTPARTFRKIWYYRLILRAKWVYTVLVLTHLNAEVIQLMAKLCNVLEHTTVSQVLVWKPYHQNAQTLNNVEVVFVFRAYARLATVSPVKESIVYAPLESAALIVCKRSLFVHQLKTAILVLLHTNATPMLIVLGVNVVLCQLQQS